MKFYSYRENETHGTDSLPVAYYKVDKQHPRYEMIHHWHNEYEIVFVNSGWLELTLDADTFFLRAGDTALINPGVMHSAVPKAAEYECLLFSPDTCIKQHLSRYEQGRAILSGEEIIPIFTVQKNPEIKKIATTLKNAMSSKGKGYELNVFSSVADIFYTVISNNLPVRASEKSLKIAKKLLPFEKVVSFIENNYRSPITLEELASKAGMSRKYFGEYFKKASGKSPIDFLNCYRVERAAEMLVHTDSLVTEIAFECGFNDLSYFIKTFKKQKNTTPARYRVGYLENI